MPPLFVDGIRQRLAQTFARFRSKRLRQRREPDGAGQNQNLQNQTVEDSLMLRLLVQVLVSIGILAADVAAGRWLGLWAIPISFLGAAWSWRQRRRRNLLGKIGIAVGMLAALWFFLSRLVSQTEDSRLLLTELLIQLQVLHSFDLPRRKDLGYSAVIGLILLSVAATLSQTTVFGVFLLLFLAIGLPLLALDYRSRLGLTAGIEKSATGQAFGRRLVGKGWGDLNARGLHLKPMALLLIGILGLSAAVFLFTPRLPGYQLRVFPVSAQIDIQGEFDPERVINPGYLRQPNQPGGGQQAQGAGGQGFAQGKVDQVFSSDFYYGFNNEINQTLSGSLTPKLVMRVRSQAAGFWRVMAFDEYTGQGWRISRNPKQLVLNRESWSFKFRLPPLTPVLNAKEIIQTYTITSEFTNLIPTLFQPRDLYFPTKQVAIDAEGSLRAPISLPEGLTYTVISDVAYRDRTKLRNRNPNYPAPIRQHYLQVPKPLLLPLRQQAENLLATANRPIIAPYEQALYLTQALKQRYQLQTSLPELAPSDDLVSAFLFKFEGGYADQFSTTLTLLLRSLGIPARLVTGLGAGEFNALTGLYEVKNTDAYALAEVFFPGYGWLAFDPIPGHPLFPPSLEVDQTFTVLQQFWHWVAGWLPSPVTNGFAQVVSPDCWRA
jgi:protein-glutamine gamma-glutamyltransferase